MPSQERQANLIQAEIYENDINEVLGNTDNTSITSDKVHAEKFGQYQLSTTSSSSNGSDIPPAEVNKKRRKKVSKAFFLSQAALSGSDASDSEDGDDNGQENDYDLADSIIDNNEYSQSESVYHRLRAAPNLKPWMNRKMKPITDSIFSQMPDGEDDSYLHDSFCVSDSFRTQKPVENGQKKKKKKKGKNLYESELEICDGWMDGFEVRRRAARRERRGAGVSSGEEEGRGGKLKRLRVDLSESGESEAKSEESGRSGEWKTGIYGQANKKTDIFVSKIRY